MKKPEVTYDEISLRVAGQRLFLYSGEIHYFRTAPKQWRDSLEKIRAANLNSISVYIPWNWHEPQEGCLDFTGATHPQRNLMAFLDLVQEQGLYIIFRPGPFICSEWLNGGIPDWLLQKHPEILALDWQAKPSVEYGMFYPPITYRHPVYLENVQRWFRHVFDAVRPYLYMNGGNIINVQLDDEESYWRTLEQGPLLADYNPALIGGGGFSNSYGRWLAEKYHSDLDRLNGVHRENRNGFDFFQPPRVPLSNYRDLPKYLDWYWFKLSEIDEYIKNLYEMVRKEGVEETISTIGHYLFSPLAWSKYAAFLRKHNLEIIQTNQYYSAPLFEISDMREDKLGSITANHEAYKAGIAGCGTPPIVMEIQSAMSAHITGPEMEELYRLVVSQGMNGLNYYMMAGGENHPGYVLSNGRSYDISSPIGYQGQLRDHYYTIRDLGGVLNCYGAALYETQTLYDVGVGFYEPYEASKFQANTLDIGFRDDYGAVFDDYFNYMICKPRGCDFFTLLTLSGVSFRMVNLEAGELRENRQLWVLGLDFMAKEIQQKLVDYVRAGGCLVLFPRIPLLDEDMQPCTILADLFGCTPIQPEPSRPSGRPPTFQSINFEDRQGVLVFDYLDTYQPPADVSIIATENRSGRVCAFSRSSGKGKAVLVGFKLRYIWDAHLDHKAFIHRLLAEGGVERKAYSHDNEMVVRERSGAEIGVLVIVNPVNLENTSRITYMDPSTGAPRIIPYLSEGLTYTRQGGTLVPLNFELPGIQARLVYSTAELINRESEPGIDRLTLKESNSPRLEIAIRSPEEVDITAEDLQVRVIFEAIERISYAEITLAKPVVNVTVRVKRNEEENRGA